MKTKKTVSALLTATLIYGALTLIIAGGFGLSMGFAIAATPNAPNLPEVQKDTPTTNSRGHSPLTAVADIDTVGVSRRSDPQ